MAAKTVKLTAAEQEAVKSALTAQYNLNPCRAAATINAFLWSEVFGDTKYAGENWAPFVNVTSPVYARLEKKKATEGDDS